LDVAIVGLGCRFPQARDPVSFWDLVRDGRLAFAEVPASRWNHARIFHDESLRTPDKSYIARGAYLPTRTSANSGRSITESHRAGSR